MSALSTLKLFRGIWKPTKIIYNIKEQRNQTHKQTTDTFETNWPWELPVPPLIEARAWAVWNFLTKEVKDRVWLSMWSRRPWWGYRGTLCEALYFIFALFTPQGNGQKPMKLCCSFVLRFRNFSSAVENSHIIISTRLKPGLSLEEYCVSFLLIHSNDTLFWVVKSTLFYHFGSLLPLQSVLFSTFALTSFILLLGCPYLRGRRWSCTGSTANQVR